MRLRHFRIPAVIAVSATVLFSLAACPKEKGEPGKPACVSVVSEDREPTPCPSVWGK